METKEKANGQVKPNGQLKAEGQEQRIPQAPAFANNNPVNKESVKEKLEPERPQAEKA